MNLLKKIRIPFKELFYFGLFPNFIKKIILKLKGAKLGIGVKIGFGSLLLADSIEIGKNVKIAPFTIINAAKIVLGESCSIGSFSYFDVLDLKISNNTRIRESVWVGGNKTTKSKLTIGSNCLILQNTILNTTEEITIGDNTAIGGGSKLFTHSSWLSMLEGYPVQQGPIEISPNVWIPYDTTILNNVNIGEHVIITPRSVINRNIPDFSIAGGQPLQINKNFYFRDLKEAATQNKFKKIKAEFYELVKYDGYQIIESFGDADIFTKNDISIVSIRPKNSLDEDVLRKISKYKKGIIVIFKNIVSENELNKLNNIKLNSNMALVYISYKHPISVNGNEYSDLTLTFLSRYGIR